MRPLTVARVGVALAAAIEAVNAAPVLNRLSMPSIVHLPLAGLPYPGDAWPLLTGLWLLAAVALAVNVRGSGWILAACLGYVVLLDQQTYSNHLMLFAILSAMHALRAYVPLMLKSQLTLVYFFAAVSKVNVAFLSGVVIAGSLRPQFAWMRSPWLLVPMAVSAIAAELFIADALWIPRRQRWAVALGVALHVGFVVLMDNTVSLLAFGLACVSMYPLFLEPEQIEIHTAGGVAHVRGDLAIR